MVYFKDNGRTYLGDAAEKMRAKPTYDWFKIAAIGVGSVLAVVAVAIAVLYFVNSSSNGSGGGGRKTVYHFR